MRSFTLNFWPGLFLAAMLRVGPGLGIIIYGLFLDRDFGAGVICGAGVFIAADGALKLYREIMRG